MSVAVCDQVLLTARLQEAISGRVRMHLPPQPYPGTTKPPDKLKCMYIYVYNPPIQKKWTSVKILRVQLASPDGADTGIM